MAPAKSTPMIRLPSTAVAVAIARSAVPVHRVDDVRAGPKSQLPHGARPPTRVQADAQGVIEKIVPAGNRVEHRRDARGRLVGGFPH